MLACALAAARPSLREAHDWLRPSIPRYGFQLLGCDVMVDEGLRPWLLEVNSSPSLMVQVGCGARAGVGCGLEVG